MTSNRHAGFQVWGSLETRPQRKAAWGILFFNCAFAESALPEKPDNLDTFSILPLIC